MGRITIFSLTECGHCRRTKAALSARNIPFEEINISTHPDRRNDMLSLSDNLTVPQVFANQIYIGGADDTLEMLKRWDEDEAYPSALERYQAEIESQPDPTDTRLKIPTSPPVHEPPPPPRNEKDDAILLPGGKRCTVLQITRRLISALPRHNISHRGKVQKNCFRGSSAVLALIKDFGMEGKKEEAIEFGQLLQRRQLIRNADNGSHIFGATNQLFRLQPYHTPKIINSFRIWSERVDPNSMSLINRLAKLMGKVESNSSDADGNVDYVAALDDENYWTFEEAVCELQGVDFASMNGMTKLAFGMNLYNIMIKHAFIKVGIPESIMQRSSFFGSVSYNVGGDILSLSDLENGVLRGNSKAPYALSKPFSNGDARMRLALSKVDSRIHFGLNCGAKSCPPVKKFTATAIDEELRIVSLAFCEQDDNVKIDEANATITLSKIFSWYRSDFGSNLPVAILPYLRGEKKAQLERMINGKKSIKVAFNAYDWSTNASSSNVFSSKSLAVSEKSIKALLVF
mmetsp:Transcript_10189/g.22854  ORF Transcript_10189/g.22854 Transcript_10189/m.22854 type:complete len:516 (-) Transcript_10189:84-1631(-)